MYCQPLCAEEYLLIKGKEKELSKLNIVGLGLQNKNKTSSLKLTFASNAN